MFFLLINELQKTPDDPYKVIAILLTVIFPTILESFYIVENSVLLKCFFVQWKLSKNELTKKLNVLSAGKEEEKE